MMLSDGPNTKGMSSPLGQRHIALCIGTRPEIIKMMPVHKALEAEGFKVDVMHTGQHSEIAADLYQHFGVKPSHDLKLSRTRCESRSDLGQLSVALLESIDEALGQIKPDAVLVHGDTSSTFNAALAAFYRQIPVGHIEAGLRTFKTYDPFPEEKNRELVGRLATWHFAPTQAAQTNLLKEGIATDYIFQVGNTVVDAILQEQARQAAMPDNGHALLPKAMQQWAPNVPYLLITAHRRENWGQPLHNIAAAVSQILIAHPDLHAIWPVHPNPTVRETIANAIKTELPVEAQVRLLLCEPLDYPGLVGVLKQACLVMTDSGGLQEEAAALNVPLLILRRTTERPEVVQSGGGKLIGVEQSDIVSLLHHLLMNTDTLMSMRKAINPFGDGSAGARIASILSSQLNTPAV